MVRAQERAAVAVDGARAIERDKKRIRHSSYALRVRSGVAVGKTRVGCVTERSSLQRRDVFVRQLEVHRERRDDLLLLLHGRDHGIELRGLAKQRARALARALQRAADAVAAVKQALKLPVDRAQRLLRAVATRYSRLISRPCRSTDRRRPRLAAGVFSG